MDLTAKIVDGAVSKYPYYLTDLCRDNPSVSFPKNAMELQSIRDEYGLVVVTNTPEPFEKGFKFDNMRPVKQADDSWVETWDKTAKEASEIEGVDLVLVDAPTVDDNGKDIGLEFRAVEGTPEKRADGKWYQTWNLEEMTWLEKRVAAYGTAEEQNEFITENGLDAWQTKVAEIKAKYPKS
tara:strand:- start:284 stop:826 length:543 start_codon:yes stop_codon:yes gene_type:complete